MKVIRATHLGMCFGVRDAIALARQQSTKEAITVLGELVHNQTVISRLEADGIRFAGSMAEVETKTVMITAHGASERAIAQVKSAGHQVLEATCPLVHHAHRTLRALVAEGFHPVVIGKRDHVEVRGLTGDFPECDIILSEADIHALTERPSFGVVAQTTQPMERVRQLVQTLRERFPNSKVVFRDTVCQPTKQRQSAAIALAQQSDVVVVIGGANSNNTRELVRTCGRFCAQVHHVQGAAELKPEWFIGAGVVGITAGTSTPDDVIDAVEAAILRMAELPAAA